MNIDYILTFFDEATKYIDHTSKEYELSLAKFDFYCKMLYAAGVISEDDVVTLERATSMLANKDNFKGFNNCVIARLKECLSEDRLNEHLIAKAIYAVQNAIKRRIEYEDDNIIDMASECLVSLTQKLIEDMAQQ